jgi:nitrogenase molybdenum-cofactor synthesis protein NifE
LAGFEGMLNFAREVHASVTSPIWKFAPRRSGSHGDDRPNSEGTKGTLARPLSTGKSAGPATSDCNDSNGCGGCPLTVSCGITHVPDEAAL